MWKGTEISGVRGLRNQTLLSGTNASTQASIYLSTDVLFKPIYVHTHHHQPPNLHRCSVGTLVYEEKPDGERVTKFENGFISFTAIALIVIGFLYAAMVRRRDETRGVGCPSLPLKWLTGWADWIIPLQSPPPKHRDSALSSAGGTARRSVSRVEAERAISFV